MSDLKPGPALSPGDRFHHHLWPGTEAVSSSAPSLHKINAISFISEIILHCQTIEAFWQVVPIIYTRLWFSIFLRRSFTCFLAPKVEEKNHNVCHEFTIIRVRFTPLPLLILGLISLLFFTSRKYKFRAQIFLFVFYFFSDSEQNVEISVILFRN